jgi:integrase
MAQIHSFCAKVIRPHKTPKIANFLEKIANFATLAGTMKKASYRVKPYSDANGRYKFVVRWKINGKWQRKFYATKVEANSFAEIKNIEIVNKGREGAEFPTWLRVMADHCQERLKPHGVTIQDATTHFLAVLEATKKSCTAVDLIQELLEAKRIDGASGRYLDDLKNRLNRFASDFNGQVVATITGTQIDDWLRGLKVGPVTRNNFRRVLIVAFNYAKGRGYCLTNPAEATAKAKEIDGPIGILTVKETSRLLNAATEETLPYFAIGCFAGLRPTELSRLDWRDVDFESGLIEVTAKNAKTARRRLVKIPPNLMEWLAPYRLHTGRVSPLNERKKLHAARVTAKLATNWPNDALRHSFASYHIAKFNDAAALALEMGHVGTSMIFGNYRELVKPAEAARYWEIRPNAEAVREKIVQFG